MRRQASFGPLLKSLVRLMPEIQPNPPAPLSQNDQTWMQVALEQARLAAQAGEVPVGALIVKDGEIVALGHNRNLLDHDPTAHAEIVALRQAAARLGNHRLIGCTMYASIEPCSMCAGALIHARVSRLVYGASDPKAGAAGSVLQVLNHPGLNHKMEVTSGVLAEKCSEIIQEFFRQRRGA
jgi:tRNA(Arg) A34 adenosine deaminase TadA